MVDHQAFQAAPAAREARGIRRRDVLRIMGGRGLTTPRSGTPICWTEIGDLDGL